MLLTIQNFRFKWRQLSGFDHQFSSKPISFYGMGLFVD
jgi:hypothetical protein